MTWNPMIFMTREQIREYDRVAVEEAGVPGIVLMENAGAGAARIARELLGAGRRVAIVAGPGNNGGDGFVIARHLLNDGFHVSVFLATAAAKIAGDALVNLRILESMSALIEDVSAAEAASGLARRLRDHGLVVDALLGTGVSRPLEGHLGALIDAINGCGTPVLAVDIPSGLDSDSGQPLGKAVRAAATATFAHLKRGLVLHPGAELAGLVTVVPIGAPGYVSDRAGRDGEILDGGEALEQFPGRPTAAHKGTFGHLMILAGSLGKTGAAALAGEAALRVGTGLVTVATTGAAQPVLEARCRAELMTEQVIERNDAPLSERSLARLAEVVEGKSAVVIGPGLSTAPGISGLVARLASTMTVPAVIDADGLNIMAADPASLGRVVSPLVLTPHPGEMARLLGKSVPAVQSDRIGTAREAARKLQAVIALKGARTVVATPDGRIWVSTTGNPGMATGGTGDVLAGIIGGLLAQGMPPLEATLLGVWLHGTAGDRAAARLGEPGLLAGDLLTELPELLRRRPAVQP